MSEPISIVEYCDNMDFMAKFPDKFFNLAICDPGYGIGETWTKNKSDVHYKHSRTYKNNSIPSKKYFKELFRVSKNQIIWGGNYFTKYLPAENSWIIWDKKRDVEKTFMSEGELAWTSFNIPMRIFRFQWDGYRKSIETGIVKIHPHQKPVVLYSWILQKYAKLGDKILDTHLGSQSSRIAAYKLGFDFWGCELDKNYFQDGCQRFERECHDTIITKQGIKIIQGTIF